MLVISTRTAPDPAIQPQVNLERWRLVEGRSPDHGITRHIVGTPEGTGKLRATTPIVEWDWGALRAVTRSGRVYRLAPADEAGHEDEGYSMMCRLTAATVGCEDVTDRVLAAGGRWPSHDA